MAQSYTPHDGKHYFPVWNRYAIRKYYTASSARMSTPVLLGGISVGGGGDRFAEHKTPPRFTEEEHRYAVRSYPIAVGVVKYPPAVC